MDSRGLVVTFEQWKPYQGDIVVRPGLSDALRTAKLRVDGLIKVKATGHCEC